MPFSLSRFIENLAIAVPDVFYIKNNSRKIAITVKRTQALGKSIWQAYPICLLMYCGHTPTDDEVTWHKTYLNLSHHMIKITWCSPESSLFPNKNIQGGQPIQAGKTQPFAQIVHQLGSTRNLRYIYSHFEKVGFGHSGWADLLIILLTNNWTKTELKLVAELHLSSILSR